MKYPM